MSWFQLHHELRAPPVAEVPAKGPRVESSFILNPALARPERPTRPRLRLVKPAPGPKPGTESDEALAWPAAS